MAGDMSYEDVFENGYCLVFTKAKENVFRYRDEERTLPRGMIPTYEWAGEFPVAKWENVLMAADRRETA